MKFKRKEIVFKMDTDENVEAIGQGKKRGRHTETWQCNIRKKNKLKGEEYKTIKGKTVSKKTIVAPICR